MKISLVERIKKIDPVVILWRYSSLLQPFLYSWATHASVGVMVVYMSQHFNNSNGNIRWIANNTILQNWLATVAVY